MDKQLFNDPFKEFREAAERLGKMVQSFDFALPKVQFPKFISKNNA